MKREGLREEDVSRWFDQKKRYTEILGVWVYVLNEMFGPERFPRKSFLCSTRMSIHDLLWKTLDARSSSHTR